ncbi:YciI family protein [Chryseolinea lacunae]|uniref:YCII-related domain-containing protein n=1 Tax=Chryseolinea lacunae TaxID=2801331 RepID=A0ABS1KUR2_9BACT|nr:YciI family protein [Chryseolinea lacunae]MBL0742056.1 hypothetical protein [Chryseolinea lacunae]
MDKKYFVLKLIPPRPDFASTMTDVERSIMHQHIAYWKPFLDTGKLLVYGPVLDPAGTFGLGIVCVENEAEARALLSNDPALSINTFEIFPMLAVVKQ